MNYIMKRGLKRQILPIILSGGMGKRLSNSHELLKNHNPKQFLKILSNRSLLQETLLRLQKESELFLNPILTINKEFVDIAQLQLNAINCKYKAMILEPYCRNTGPAITLALLYGLKHYNNDQLVAIFPVDHYFYNFNDLIHIIKEVIGIYDLYQENPTDNLSLYNKIISFGMRPNEPDNNQYGYVHQGDEIDNIVTNSIFKSQHFLEKPKKHMAKKLTQSGKFLWNMGIYIGTISSFLNKLYVYSYDTYALCQQAIKQGIEIDKKNMTILQPHQDIYAMNQSISIDKSISEKTENLLVAHVNTEWSDLGSLSNIEKVFKQNEVDLSSQSHDFLKIISLINEQKYQNDTNNKFTII